MFVISQIIYPGRPSHPCVMFVGNARSLPQYGAPERFFGWVGFCLNQIHQTRLELRINTLACYEHSQIKAVKRIITVRSDLTPSNMTLYCYNMLGYCVFTIKLFTTTFYSIWLVIFRQLQPSLLFGGKQRAYFYSAPLCKGSYS